MLQLSASIIVIALVFSCSDKDKSTEGAGKTGDAKKACAKLTSEGMSVIDGKVSYDLNTRATTVTAAVCENKLPKAGAEVSYTLFCGDARYGALEAKLIAKSNAKGLASVSKVPSTRRK